MVQAEEAFVNCSRGMQALIVTLVTLLVIRTYRHALPPIVATAGCCIARRTDVVGSVYFLPTLWCECK